MYFTFDLMVFFYISFFAFPYLLCPAGSISPEFAWKIIILIYQVSYIYNKLTQGCDKNVQLLKNLRKL